MTEERERFRPVATRGRILYEAIAGLSALDQMYSYSLQFFKNIYLRTLEGVKDALAEEGTATLGEKLERMIAAITEACFLAVQRGIFARHKQSFAFMIAAGI